MTLPLGREVSRGMFMRVGTCAVGEGQVPTGDDRGPLPAPAVASSVISPAGRRRRK